MPRAKRLLRSVMLISTALSTTASAGPLTLTTDPAVSMAVVFNYDPANGNLSYDGNGQGIMYVEVLSNAELFDPPKVN